MKLLSRRNFLIAGAVVGGGLMIGIGGVAGYVGSHDRLAMQKAQQAGAAGTLISLWLRIEPSGAITLLAPHTEMGQGSQTGLRQLAAEELDVPFELITVEQAPADTAFATGDIIEGFLFGGDLSGWSKTFGSGLANRIADAMDMQMTGGSTAVRFTGWMSMRTAAAAAREMLVAAAAATLAVSASELSTGDGRVTHAASGRFLTYGELATDAAQQPVPAEPKLKDPSQWRYVGKPMARFDLPDKVFGTADYGLDRQMPGMKYAAATITGPFGVEVTSIDNEAEILALRGVSSVHIVPGGVAVVADNPWRAEQAVRKVKVTLPASDDASVDSAEIYRRMDQALDGSLSSLHSAGDLSPLDGGADVEAVYRTPFLAHAPMEPMNCTVWEEGGKLHVAAGVQNPLGSLAFASVTSGRAREEIELHAHMMGGGFGRRAVGGDRTHTFMEQAIALHQATGEPIQLTWSREQDTRAGSFRPADTVRLRAKLGADGKPVAWEGRSYTDVMAPDEALPPYTIAGVAALSAKAAPFLPYAFWRSVDASSHCFFVESFIDECAAQAGQDPMDYRLSLLDPASRHAGVLRLAKQMSGYRPGVDGDGRAMGVAVSHCFGSYVAAVASVSMVDGKPRVHDLWLAADCGVVVNPDSVEAQIQGGALYGLSAALYGRIDVQDGKVVQGNFHDYKVVRFADAPRLHVATVPSTEDPGGVGEVGTPAVAPAVANALALLGERKRELPLT